MRNLFDKMKPIAIANLKKEEEYPNIHAQAVEELKRLYIPFEITYRTLLILSNHNLKNGIYEYFYDEMEMDNLKSK